MKKVHAIVREERVADIVERLVLIGVRGLTIGSVKGFGRTSGHTEVFRGSAYKVDFVSKVQIEWYGPDEKADAVMRAIEQRAVTGKLGDGKIFVEDVEEAVRIRTGERGPNAA
jgi:nitrogen regulatory protein P-II 1